MPRLRTDHAPARPAIQIQAPTGHRAILSASRIQSTRFGVAADSDHADQVGDQAVTRAPGVGDWVTPGDRVFGEVGRADRLERGRSLPPGRLDGYLRRYGERSCAGHR